MNKRKLKGLESLGEAPIEASQNLKSSELAPSDGRITGRTKPLSLKSTPEFHKELKSLATEEECLMIEVLEKALESYKKEKQVQAKELEKYRKIIPAKPKKPQKKLRPYFNQNFTCDNCYNEFQNEVAYSYASSLDQAEGYYTYCSNCVVSE